MLDDATLIGLIKGFILVLSYGLLGGLIKYIDQAFDEGVFNRKLAVFSAAPAGLLMGTLMVWNSASATIFLAVVLAVAISRKIDNGAFQLGAGLLFFVPLIFHGIFTVYWFPLGVLLFAGIADELGNDWSDKRKLKRAFIETTSRYYGSESALHQVAEGFFTHRLIMKAALLALTAFRVFHPVYLIAFLGFDAAYLTVDKLSTPEKRYRLVAAGDRPYESRFKTKSFSLQ